MSWKSQLLGKAILVASIFACVCACATFFINSPVACGDDSTPSSTEDAKTFWLKEINIFEPVEQKNEQGIVDYARRGVAVLTNEQKTKGVRYPSFISENPRFGVLEIGRSIFTGDSVATIPFAVDEMDGTGTGYNLFYVDANGNHDLTDDDPLLQEDLTDEEKENNDLAAKIEERGYQFKAFYPIKVSWPGAQLPPDYQLYPAAMLGFYGEKEADKGTPQKAKQFVTVLFRYPTIRIGTVQIGPYTYRLALTNPGLLPDFSHPSLIEVAYEPNDQESPAISWWGSRTLSAVHRVDGKYYTMKATPSGDRITIAPYQGKLGTFRVGLGRRSLKDSQNTQVLAFGGLRGAKHSVYVGDSTGKTDKDQGVAEIKLPVGEYSPAYLDVQYGDVQLEISENYHIEGMNYGMPPIVPCIEISEDEPYTLDLSNDPEVMFVSPSKQTTVHRGESISIEPVLVDPELGIMVRGIQDLSEKKEVTETSADGEEQTRTEYKSLAPTIKITNAQGKVVDTIATEYG